MRSIRMFTALLLFSSLSYSGCKDDKAISDSGKTLTIQPVYQSMSKWCWAATCEMVFRYYNVCAANPVDYQCGIIAFLAPNCYQYCYDCDVTAPTIYDIQSTLLGYPQIAMNYCGGTVHYISSTAIEETLTEAEIKSEIDNNRPIVVGISPSDHAFSLSPPSHASLLIGYECLDHEFSVIINDPWPYDVNSDPYIRKGGELVQPGQYKIRYRKFKNRINWKQSIKNVQAY